MRAWFPNDRACLDYLDGLRWPHGFVCPHCGSVADWPMRDGRHRCSGCDRRVSVTAGTVFDKTRTPLTVWFEAAWLMMSSKAGLSALNLQRVTGIGSYQTAWAMLHRFRSVMVASRRDLLSGTVEVDETFVGGPRPGKTGRGALGKTLVAGAIEQSLSGRGFGRARLEVIADASAVSFAPFLSNTVAAGSTVITDAWPGYLPAVPDTDFAHHRLNVRRSGLQAHELLPGVHRLFSLLHRGMGGTHQGAIRPEHLQSYLDKFVFRFNRCRSRQRGMLFLRFLERCVDAAPVTYRCLVVNPTPKRVKPRPPGARGKPATLAPPPLDRPWRSIPDTEH